MCRIRSMAQLDRLTKNHNKDNKTFVAVTDVFFLRRALFVVQSAEQFFYFFEIAMILAKR